MRRTRRKTVFERFMPHEYRCVCVCFSICIFLSSYLCYASFFHHLSRWLFVLLVAMKFRMHSVWLFWPEYVAVHCVDAGTETKPNRTETGKPAVVAAGKILSRLNSVRFGVIVITVVRLSISHLSHCIAQLKANPVCYCHF